MSSPSGSVRRPWMLPLVPLYLAGAALRWAGVRPRRLGSAVVSVGNLSAGGTGKTPFVIALAKMLTQEGIAVDVLSRGYGRTGSGAERVEPDLSPDGNAERSGDEPLLIAREAGVPVFVGSKRFEAGVLAEREGRVGVHLLDDGFQHRQLYRDVDVVLLNAEDLGDKVLPAGNLREPVSALERASVFAVPAEDNSALARLGELGFPQPVWRFRRKMIVPEVVGPVVAFCGIARPEQFFLGLEAAGMTLAGRQVFRDHHRFAANDIEALRRLIRKTGAVALVTTEKDRIRLGAYLGVLEAGLGVPLLTAGLRVVMVDESGVLGWLRQRLEL